MRFFDASGEKGLNNSDSYNLDKRENTQSFPVNSTAEVTGNANSTLIQNGDPVIANFSGTDVIQTANRESNEQQENKTEVNSRNTSQLINKNLLNEAFDKGSENHSQYSGSFNNGTESKYDLEVGEPPNDVGNGRTIDLTRDDKSFQMSSHLIGAGKEPDKRNFRERMGISRNDMKSRDQKEDLKTTKSEGTENTKSEGTENTMQMDKRWMAETVAKLNRVVDSILRSIATGDIRVVEEEEESVVGGELKNATISGVSEVTSRSVTIPTSTPLSLVEPDTTTNTTSSRVRKPRRRNKNRQPKANKDKRKRTHRRKRRCHNKRCHPAESGNISENNEAVHFDATNNSVQSGTLRSENKMPSKLPSPRQVTSRKKRGVPQSPPSEEGLSLRSPCLPKGSKGRLMLDGQEITIIGTFNRRQKFRCRNQVRELVQSRIDLPITGGDQKVLLTGAFYYIADSAGLMSECYENVSSRN